jgi:RNA polymerase sigma-70 factor (ECF subfamily)
MWQSGSRPQLPTRNASDLHIDRQVSVLTLLLDDARAGDESAFLRLIEPVLPAAERLARAMLDGRPEAEDALQEAVVNAWKHLRQFKAGFPVEPWFLAIVANQCRMQRRVRWWSVMPLSRAQEMPIAGGQPSPEITDLRRALQRLPHHQRLLLVLRYYLDQSFEDIGRTLGISAGAAKSRTLRALKRLRLEVPEEVSDD